MDNETLTVCKNESLSGGAIPNDGGALYYGMVAVSSQAISQNRRLNHKHTSCPPTLFVTLVFSERLLVITAVCELLCERLGVVSG